MLPYILLLIIVLLCSNQYDKTKSSMWLFTIFAAFTLLVGLRDVNVGTDTWNYYFMFEDKQTLSQLNFIQNVTHEIMFDVLVLVSQNLSNNYAALFFLVGFIVYACTLLVCKRLTQSMFISMYVFITLGISAFCYNGERQGIAVAIYMFAIPFAINRNFRKYTLFVILASLFHRTCIVAIPMYFLFTMRFSKKTIAYIIGGSVLLTYLLPLLLAYASTLSDRYQGYLEASQGGGELLALSYFVMAVFFVYARRFIPEADHNRYDVYLMMFISGSTIYAIVMFTGIYIEICRFAAYFHISALFIWPMILKNKNHKVPQYIHVAFFLGHLGFMYVFYSRMAMLVPYIFNTTLF